MVAGAIQLITGEATLILYGRDLRQLNSNKTFDQPVKMISNTGFFVDRSEHHLHVVLCADNAMHLDGWGTHGAPPWNGRCSQLWRYGTRILNICIETL